MRTILFLKGFILSKAEQLGLFAVPVQVAGSVDKHGTVRKPHVRIQKVRAKEAPPVRRKPAAEPSPTIGARLRAWLDKHGGLGAVAKIIAEAPESARTKMLELMAGAGRVSVAQVRAMLEGATPGAAQADLFSQPPPRQGEFFLVDADEHGEVPPARVPVKPSTAFVTPPRLDLPVVEHDGDTWHVLSTGAAREDGKVFARLSSTTRGRHTKGGVLPVQRADWVERDKLGMAPPAAPLPIVEHTTKKGKTLRGVVRADLTKEEAQAIDPYTFRKDDGWFIREKHLGDVSLADEGKTAQPAENTASTHAAAAPEPIDWEARAADNRRLNTYTPAEHAAAIASLQPGDVIRSRVMAPSVTGIVERIVGPGEGDSSTQVQIRWADDGKPRQGNGHGTRAFYNDFFLRDGTLYTTGMNDGYPPEAWDRVGVNPGTQLDLTATPKASATDARKPAPPSAEALPFGVPAGTTKAERRRLNAEAVELVRRGGPYSEAEQAALRQYSGTGGVGDSLNEFYTLPEVATAMWSVAARLGLEAGDVLEPSCGAGVFLHTAPAGVKVTGVELDPTSSAVAKALHGDRHEIQNASLERFAQQDGRRFKAAIGNVPFGLRGALIKDDKPHLKTAEAYFCDTALDKCEPGGLVGLIVPTGVMDGKNNRALRERLLRKGEFLGAQRMPNTAFEHSHTEVTTDVLWFRKRPDDVAGALSHASVTQKMLRNLGVWDDEFLSGVYFTGRGAGNVFGSMEAGWRAKAGMGADITVVGSMRGVPEALAEFTPDVTASSPSMQSILAQFDGDEAARAKVLGAAMTRPYETKAKVGDTKTVDGVVYVLQGRPPRWHRVDEVLQSDALTRAQAIARELDDLIEGRRGVDRAQLEKDLQAWVDEYGTPSRNKDVLLGAQQDRVLYRLVGAVKADGSLSDAVRGVVPKAVKGSFESTVTALLLDREAVSVEDIAARAGVDPEEALDHLYASPRYAFDPQAGRWTTRDIYLSGDLWAKLDAVRAGLADADTPAELRKKLEGQEAALSAAIEPASLEDVFVQMNSAFVPTEVLAAFWNWKYHDSPAANDWTKKLPPVEITFENGLYRIKGGNEYGDQKLLDKYLNRTGLRKDDKPTIDALNDEFKDWLCASPYREQLEELYNRKFRGYVSREFSNEPMDIPGLAGEGLKDYQWGGLRWALNAGKGIIAADVGLGKTARALLLTRTLKLSGRAQKPLIVVPKSVLANWFAECEKWFPGSRVMTIGGSFEHQADGTLKGKDDTAAERKRKYHDLQQNDYDFIICSEPAFEEVDLDPATKNDYNARDFWVQRGDRLGNEGDKRTKKIREAWEQSRAGQEFGESSRTDATYFNELGVDALIADEMHHCFPAGTLVDGRRIETLKAGDLVKSFNHETGAIEEKPVLAVARLPAKPLARVTLSNGQKIVSTFDHLFFTLQSGYTPAQHLTGFSDVMISTITTSMVTSDGRLVQGVREYIHPVAVAGLEGGRRSESVLQQGVLSSASQKAYDAQADDRQDVFGVREAVRVEQSAALEDGVREGSRVLLRPEMRNSLEKFQAGGSGLAEIAGNSEEAQRSAERAQLASDARGSPEKDGGAQGYWPTQPRRTASQRREWSGAIGSAGHACRGAWVEDGICCADQRAEGLGVSVALQDRHCEPGSQDCNRGRWEQPCERCAPSSGREEGRLLGVARVVSVEILQPGGDGEFERLCPEGDVYDIEVADNHNFFAEGVLVHNCKNLYAAKSRFGDQPKFLGGQGLSMRALDFNLKARWILDQNDGKNVYGLTATPTKNSPLEIYSMLSHVAPEAFERIGVRNSEEFLDRFAKFEDGMALNTRGEMEEALVTSGFRNMDELRAIMQRYIHRQTADDVGLKLPGRDDRTHFVEMDDEQQKVYAELRELAEESGGKDATGDAHIFSIMDKMNKAAMDLSLLDPDQYAGRSSPKYQACAEQVVAGLRDGGQIIFADYVDAHDKMVEALVKAGIPRAQVGVINAKVAGSAVKRQQIADAFNAGKLRVVIGNTATMGEGLNLQKGTADIHHLDLPWEPASMQQRNGRGLRQGNTNASIRIHSYLARGSFDGYRYQSMMAKKDWQDLIWSGGDELENLSRQGNVSRDEMMIMLAADPDQARAAFEANTKAKEERFAAGKRAEAAGRFVKFQSLKRSFGELKNKDTASAQRLKAKIDRERAALAADRYFPAKDALDLDNVVIEPESGRAIVVGHGLEFEEDGKPDRYVVTGTDYRTGAVTVRRYGETSGVKRTWPLEKLKGSKAYAYDDKAEAAEIGRRLEEEAKAGATRIKSLDEVMKLPPRIASELHGQLQEALWKGAKDYTININGKVPMVEKATGKPVIAESYNVRQLSPETHDFMLPTEENRERAIQGWMEARRASKFDTDTNQARRGGRTTTVARRKYGVLQNDNPWSSIVATMHGEAMHYGATPPSVKAARARLEKEQNERILRAKSLAEAFDHAAAIGKIAEPSQGYSARVTLPKKTLATLWAKAKRLGVLGEPIEAHTPTVESKTYPKHSSYFVGRTGTARSTLLRMAVGSGHNDLVRAMVESSLPTMEPREALEALGAVSAGYGLGEGGMKSDRARAMIALAEKAGVMDVTKDALGFRDGHLSISNPWAPDRRDTVRTILERVLAHATERERAAADAIEKVA